MNRKTFLYIRQKLLDIRRYDEQAMTVLEGHPVDSRSLVEGSRYSDSTHD